MGTIATLLATKPGIVTVICMGAQEVFLGDLTVTVGKGLLLPNIRGRSVKIVTKENLYGIALAPSMVGVISGTEADFSG